MNTSAVGSLVLICAAQVCALAFAQADADKTTAARALDLSVPATQVHVPDAAAWRNAPPGLPYGAVADPALRENADGRWQVHGIVDVGVGWSNRGGNSNWQ